MAIPSSWKSGFLVRPRSTRLRVLCRLFLLDMLLGNADRLPCEVLGWRGNPHNIMFCTAGAHAGRMVAIDSAVQRRPPGVFPLNCAVTQPLPHT